MMRCRMNKMVSYLMLVVYLGYFTGTTIFIHQHQFQNHIVVHSHPYTNHQHEHTANQLLMLDQLQDRTSTEAVYFYVPIVAESLCCALTPVLSLQPVCDCDVAIPQLRAPPVV